MKHILLALLSCVAYNTHAQSSNDNVIGRHGDQHYVVKKDGYYIAEYFGSEKAPVVLRDTLLPVGNSTDTFRGRTNTLLLEYGSVYLGSVEKGYRGIPLSAVTEEDKKRRIQLHNYFYYLPYKSNMTQYVGSPKDSDKNRGGIYIQIRELSIEEFKLYFDTFILKHKIERSVK